MSRANARKHKCEFPDENCDTEFYGQGIYCDTHRKIIKSRNTINQHKARGNRCGEKSEDQKRRARKIIESNAKERTEKESRYRKEASRLPFTPNKLKATYGLYGYG